MDSEKFNVGDQVKLIRKDHTGYGAIGIVSNVDGDNFKPGPYVKFPKNPLLDGGWFDTSLELVTATKPESKFDTKLHEELGESVYFGKPVPPYKERKPDEINWEAHRAYLKSLR